MIAANNGYTKMKCSGCHNPIRQFRHLCPIYLTHGFSDCVVKWNLNQSCIRLLYCSNHSFKGKGATRPFSTKQMISASVIEAIAIWLPDLSIVSIKVLAAEVSRSSLYRYHKIACVSATTRIVMPTPAQRSPTSHVALHQFLQRRVQGLNPQVTHVRVCAFAQ